MVILFLSFEVCSGFVFCPFAVDQYFESLCRDGFDDFLQFALDTALVSGRSWINSDVVAGHALWLAPRCIFFSI